MEVVDECIFFTIVYFLSTFVAQKKTADDEKTPSFYFLDFIFFMSK